MSFVWFPLIAQPIPPHSTPEALARAKSVSKKLIATNLFTLAFAATIAPLAASAGVTAATSTDPGVIFRIPRGVVVLVPFSSIMTVEMVSTGDRLVPLESDEGQAIYRENKPSAVRRHFIRSTE